MSTRSPAILLLPNLNALQTGIEDEFPEAEIE
jgi:hypothetical protein